MLATITRGKQAQSSPASGDIERVLAVGSRHEMDSRLMDFPVFDPARRAGLQEPAARFIHCTPPDVIAAESAGDELPDALFQILSQFGTRKHASHIVDTRTPGHRRPDAALMFAIAPGIVHVVGSSPLAEQIRGTLSGGAVTGWRLHPLPDNTTPLHTLRPRLESRFYNLLDRNGFTSVEEAIAAPDAALLQLRHAGPRFVAALRGLAGEHICEPVVTNPTDVQDAHQRRTYLLGRLHEATAARYRDLVDALAHSTIPLAALDKIATALCDEPVPPADPTVTLLLETAGEQQILNRYLSTHQKAE